MLRSGQRLNPRWGKPSAVQIGNGGFRLLINARVIAACIPSLRPLAAKIWRSTHRAPAMTSKSSKTAHVRNGSASLRKIWPVRGNQDETKPAGFFTRLEDSIPFVHSYLWGRDTNTLEDLNRGTTGADDIGLEDFNESHSGIQVQNEITISSEAWDYKDQLY